LAVDNDAVGRITTVQFSQKVFLDFHGFGP
jgi:hypothetical protein